MRNITHHLILAFLVMAIPAWDRYQGFIGVLVAATLALVMTALFYATGSLVGAMMVHAPLDPRVRPQRITPKSAVVPSGVAWAIQETERRNGRKGPRQCRKGQPRAVPSRPPCPGR